PHQGSGAQPDVADLPNRGEERVAVGGIHTVVHGLEHPTRARIQQRRHVGRRGLRQGQRSGKQLLRPCLRSIRRESAQPPPPHRRTAAPVSAPVAAQSARAIGTPSRLPTDPHRVEPSACAPKNATWHTPSARARAQAGVVICATAPNVVPAASHAAPKTTTAKAASTQCRETLSRAIAAYASSEATSTSLPGKSRPRITGSATPAMTA